MRLTSKAFWDAVGNKIIETLISVKIWIMGFILFFVHRLFLAADELRTFIMASTSLDAQKLQILVGLQGKIYDIAVSLLISGVVVIVLSRVTFQYAKLKNGYHDVTLSEDQKNSVDEIKNNFA